MGSSKWIHKGDPDSVELMNPSADGSKPSSSSPAYPAPAATYNGGINSMEMGRQSSDGGGGPLRVFASRLLRGSKNSKGLTRFGLPKGSFMLYIDDLYHTLLNMPRYRFLFSFFVVYFCLYLFFSFFYLAITEECIGGEMNFAHAFWFSVWTASTIGYAGTLAPSPDCPGVNILVMFQLISAALIDTMLMSLVFSRFAAPMPRASALRFSTHAVLARPRGSRHWSLSFRLANIRKHSLMEPEIVLLLAMPDVTNAGTSAFRFTPLVIDDMVTQVTSLKLGLPVTITHVITPDSPMYDVSVAGMEAAGMEVLCFMSGMDPMTSNSIQAHHAYRPMDVRMNEQFVAIHISTNKTGRLGVDLSVFDATNTAEVGMGFRDESRQVLYPVPSEGFGKADVRQHMEELRRCTIRSLTVPAVTRASSTGQMSHELELDNGKAPNGTLATIRSAGSENGAVLMAGSGKPWQHPLQWSKGDGGDGSPMLPVSWAPPLPADGLPQRGSAPSLVGMAGATGAVAGQWDAAVKALCEAVGDDAGASAAVRQRAASLRSALLAVPAGRGPGAGGAGSSVGGSAHGPPVFDML